MKADDFKAPKKVWVISVVISGGGGFSGNVTFGRPQKDFGKHGFTQDPIPNGMGFRKRLELWRTGFWCTSPWPIKQKGWQPSSVPRIQPLHDWAWQQLAFPHLERMSYCIKQSRFGSHWIFLKARTMMASRDWSWLGEVLKRFSVWSPCLL